MLEPSFLYINETSLFFHNRRFDTPLAKKDVTRTIRSWVKGLPPPDPVLRLEKKRKTTTVSQHSARTSIPSTFNQSSESSRNCAIVTAPTTTALGNKRSLKRKHSDLGSHIDEPNVPTTVYGGLQDEDDTLEELAALACSMNALAAAEKNKTNIIILPGHSTRVKLGGSRGRLGNKGLPEGALDGGKWTVTFRQTFLKYLGGLNQNIWALEENKTIEVLQAIWDAVYKGNGRVGEKKVVYVVKKGDAVYKTALQRATEWRNSIASAAISAINNFFDYGNLTSTEARQEMAAEFLVDLRYAFAKTEEVIKNGKKRVKKGGRYQGALITHTLAQHLIDTESAITVPCLMGDDDFPKGALALSATAVHRALWLWSEGHITYESYTEAKAKDGKDNGGIIKVRGPDGKPTNDTYFSKGRWEDEVDMHIREVWAIPDDRNDDHFPKIRAATEKARQTILLRKAQGKRKATNQAAIKEKRARGAANMAPAASDSDFW